MWRGLLECGQQQKMKEEKEEEGEVVSGVARLHNYSQSEQKESKGNQKRGSSRRRESCPCTQGNLAQPLPFFPLALSFSSNPVLPRQLSGSRPANWGKLCEKLQRNIEEAALWNSWVDPVVTQGGNKGRTRWLTHALSAETCTHLHTDSQWQERERALRRRPWSSSRR